MPDKSSLNRRQFLQRAFAGAATLGLSGSLAHAAAAKAAKEAAAKATGAAAAAKPFNVLFIVSDDLNDWVGAFGGNPDTQTPNLDRLCKRGVTFQRAYTCSPLCNPTRAAILTGHMASSTGVYDNRQPFRQSERGKDAVTLPQYFMQHGYYTAAAGKIYHMHFPDPQSWNEYSTDGTDKGKSAGPQGESDKSKKSKKDKTKDDGLKPNDDEKVTVASIEWEKLDTPEEETTDYTIADYCIRQLQKKHDKPFFLGCGFRKPHLPWAVPRKYFDKFPPDKLTLPKVKEDDLADVPSIGKAWAKPEVHEEIVKAGKWREAVGAYWHLGEKLHWHKSTLWEEADRAPLTITVPGLTQPGGQCARTVDFISIYPTLVELCGLPPKKDNEGVSLAPLLKQPDAPWDRPATTDFQYGNTAVRSERWRYIHYKDGTEELYDHDADEMEWTNLADDPKYDGVKKDLARWLPKRYTKDSPHQYFPGDEKKQKKDVDAE
ncbi:MAG: sulfatase [Candidatus Sumerlaeota bacterium]|nr:sulfatase [Candidatus Sumerlaeota bacterium]